MFDIILARDSSYGIGKGNKLPWGRIKEELSHFKKITEGNSIIFGRKTFESLPDLPNRKVYSVSWSKKSFLEKIMKDYKNSNKKLFIGGGSVLYGYVFDKYVDLIDNIHLSKIKGEYKADKFFTHSYIDDKNDYFAIKQVVEFERFTYQHLVRSEEGQYKRLLRDVMTADERNTRNSITRSVFNPAPLVFNLSNGHYPLLTTKRMFFRGVVEELLFFIRGDTNTMKLENKKINIWKGNTSQEFLDKRKLKYKEGEMGPMYGYQWRHFNKEYNMEESTHNGVDQLKNVVNMIRENPNSRRIMLVTYNPCQNSMGVLPPCHSIVLQFYVRDGFLDMFCYNRSSDIFLGLPFNIASSSLLLILLAKITGLVPGRFTLSLGDAHIYKDHYNAVKEQLKNTMYTFPELYIPDISSLEDIEKMSFDNFNLVNYRCHKSIKAKMIA